MKYVVCFLHLRFPQVAPEKEVCEQSQTYLFQPSVQVPPCMQGWSWQWPGILWHDERIEPAIKDAGDTLILNMDAT